jgi:hypothetical protein
MGIQILEEGEEVEEIENKIIMREAIEAEEIRTILGEIIMIIIRGKIIMAMVGDLMEIIMVLEVEIEEIGKKEIEEEEMEEVNLKIEAVEAVIEINSKVEISVIDKMIEVEGIEMENTEISIIEMEDRDETIEIITEMIMEIEMGEIIEIIKIIMNKILKNSKTNNKSPQKYKKFNQKGKKVGLKCQSISSRLSLA